MEIQKNELKHLKEITIRIKEEMNNNMFWPRYVALEERLVSNSLKINTLFAAYDRT